uniref:Uncharacterized protein n=1 Tax=Avena sativa TaxID=4498 RepID=A0ACD5VA68_AVESA
MASYYSSTHCGSRSLCGIPSLATSTALPFLRGLTRRSGSGGLTGRSSMGRCFALLKTPNTSKWSWQWQTTRTKKTGLWGNLISTVIPSDTSISNRPFIVTPGKPARLVGNSLYWLLAGNSFGLLEFDLERQNLAVIPVPVDLYSAGRYWDFMVTRAEGGGSLGFFFLSDFTAQLWKRTTNADGVASWILGRTIEVDKLLSLNPEEQRGHLWLQGYAEDSNVVFLRTLAGLFLIHLESLQFKKLSKYNLISCYQPFECVYAAGI